MINTIVMNKHLFKEKNIAPMLIKEQKVAFNDPDFIFELKFDGLRCITYLDPEHGTDLRNKRDVSLLKLYPELKELHRYVNKRCILDGELVLFENGVPNFYKMQRRSIMKDPFKIQITAKQAPVSFIAFDMLALGDENLMKLSLMQRKEFLKKHVKDSERLYVNRYIEDMGIPFYVAVEERNLEGIVAKRKDSIYQPGKRSTDWIKIKNINEDDFIVCGYFYQQSKDGLTLILGQYGGDTLIYRGNVSLGVNNLGFLNEYGAVKSSIPVFDLKLKHVEWLEPYIVCVIHYMYKTKQGALRQPVLKGFRKDKSPKECKIESS